AAGAPRPPAPEDPRPEPSPGACSALAAILASTTYRPVLGEWLALAGATGHRLPPELVPALLDALGTEPPALRATGLQVAGPIAGWLAARNNRWSWVTDAAPGGVSADPHGASRAGAGGSAAQDLAARWAERELADAERVWLLRELRRLDSDAARHAAEATRAGDPVTVRVAAIAVIAEQAGAADEAFLEAALSDPRKEVRSAAYGALAAMTGSAFARRMAARAVPLVEVAGTLRRTLRVRLPPGTLTDGEAAALSRDGIAVPRRQDRARDAWWLARQVIGATPLEAWTSSLRRDPAELVALAEESELGGLLEAWAEAAFRQRRGDWAKPLAVTKHLADTAGELGLFEVITPADLEDLAVAALGRWRLGDRATSLVTRGSRPWSPRLSRAVLEALAAQLAEPSLTGATTARAFLGTVGTRLHPDLAGEAIGWLGRLLASLEVEPSPAPAVPRPAAGLPAGAGTALVAALVAAPRGAAPPGAGPPVALAPVTSAVGASHAFWRAPLANMFSVLAFRNSLHEEMR
ncbi:MAG TPA: DUF5691 domain-containing protein, partial [Acidimicrobiales bacterium]|nr:DUF5691 domain-containing protein [Acidimicrobiales bacterium]